MEIRLAAMDDLAAVTALEAVCFPPAEAAQEDSLRARLAAYPNHFWLLEDEGRLVSFVNGLVTDAYDLTDEMFDDVSYHSENGGWQMIFGVATHPDYQRRGCAEKLLRYVVEKGSITVDGISLTVAAVGEREFSISAIPHTVRQTVLHHRRKGDLVNLETDIIGKYIEKLLQPAVPQPKESTITRDLLSRCGF